MYRACTRCRMLYMSLADFRTFKIQCVSSFTYTISMQATPLPDMHTWAIECCGEICTSQGFKCALAAIVLHML